MSAADRQMSGALGRIPSGLFIVTLTRDTLETGMLASWVQQCSFDPLEISLALQKGREIAPLLTPGSAFTLNILDESQTDMIGHFGRGYALTEPAFTGLDVIRGESNGPILSEALAYLTCEVTDRFPAGDHDLFIARVIAGQVLGDGHPMVHIRKSGMHY